MHPRSLLGTLCRIAGALGIAATGACSDLSQPVRPTFETREVLRQQSRRDGPISGPTSMPIYIGWYSCAQTFSGQFYNCVYSGTQVIGDDYWDMAGRFNTTRNCEWAGDVYCDQTLRAGPFGGTVGTDVSNETMFDSPDAATTIPDCAQPKNAFERAYCTGVVPGATARARITAALDDMDSIGGVCSSLAQLGRTLIANGELRVFPNGNFRAFGGGAPKNGANINPARNRWLIISDAFTKRSTTLRTQQQSPRTSTRLAHCSKSWRLNVITFKGGAT